MAVDIFLKIDGIKGESQDDKHKGEIDVLSWSWGASQTGVMHAGGGGGAGKANIQDIQVSKYLDAATPNLLRACISGEHIKNIVLTMRKAGKAQQEYFTIKLDDALISSVADNGRGAGDERPVETFSINFAKVNVAYKPQKPDGTLDAAVQMGWDLKKNIKV